MSFDPYREQPPMLILEDAAITRLLHDQRFLEAFPFLQAAATRLKEVVGQRSCCGRTSSAKSESYTAIKQAIGGMTTENKARFKQLLGAEQVRLVYVHGKQRMRLTF